MSARTIRQFFKDQDGVVLVEAFLALPVLLLLTIGILEFGTMMWQRQQLQVGVRDAARYWSRCRPLENGAAFMPCSRAQAINIAVFGNPDGNGNPRVPGWTTAEVTVAPEAPSGSPLATDLVTVSALTTYQGSPLFSAVLGNNINIGYRTTMRYIGW